MYDDDHVPDVVAIVLITTTPTTTTLVHPLRQHWVPPICAC